MCVGGTHETCRLDVKINVQHETNLKICWVKLRDFSYFGFILSSSLPAVIAEVVARPFPAPGGHCGCYLCPVAGVWNRAQEWTISSDTCRRTMAVHHLAAARGPWTGSKSDNPTTGDSIDCWVHNALRHHCMQGHCGQIGTGPFSG